MPDPDFVLRQNDTASQIAATLTDDDGNAVSIQSATVRFNMKPIAGGPSKVAAAATNAQVGDGTDGSKGHVLYQWLAANTDTAGLYVAEWQVTFAGSAIQTFPNDRNLLVRITPEIG